MRPRDHIILQSVVRWFEKAVLGLNLCPFARGPYHADSIVFELSQEGDDEQCLIDLYLQLDRLDRQANITTIVLVCPHLLSFEHYLDFLQLGQSLLEREGWEGIYQIASFHPDYHFHQTRPQDRENWTNRSPFPLLHLLREDSISEAVAGFGDTAQIVGKNLSTLRDLGDDRMLEIFGPRYFRE